LSPERSAPVSATGVQVTSAHPEARALYAGPHDKPWSDKATGQGTQDVVGVGVLLITAPSLLDDLQLNGLGGVVRFFVVSKTVPRPPSNQNALAFKV